MQTFAWYLLQANIILLVLGLVYALLLRKETFYQLNRLIMGAIIMAAFLLPLSPAPNWVASVNSQLLDFFPTENPANHPLITPSISIQESPNISTEGNVSGLISKDKKDFISPLHIEEQTSTISTSPTLPVMELEQTSLWNSWFWITFYGLITVAFLLRFLLRIIALSRVIGNGEQVSSSLVYSKHPISPFSFGSFIVLNPNQYQADMLDQIIQHERVHVQQWHTLDIIVAEILTIFCWFNPMSWWLSKTIRLNLEYIADAAVLHSGVQRKSYQYNLLKISHPEYKIQLANNFNHSLLKNRIIMMNTKKSPISKLWKYTLLLPFIFMLLLGVNIGTAQKGASAIAKNDAKIEVYGFKDNKSYRAEDRSIYEDEAMNSEAESLAEEQAEETIALAEEARENAAETEEEIEEQNWEIDETHDGIESDILGDLDDFAANKENVFVIIRPGLEPNDFKVIRNQLDARDIEARFDNQNYNDGQLTQIRFSVKVNGQQFVQETDFKDDQPLVFYVSHYKNKKIGMEKGISKDFPAKTQDLMKRVTGIFFMTDDETQDDLMTYGRYEFKKEDTDTDPSNIYVVITQKTTEGELKQIKKDLAEKGLFIDIQTIDVNEYGIESITIKARDDAGFNGHISASFDKYSTDGKVYLYRFDGKSGMGHGNQLENNQHIPDRMKKILKRTNSSNIGSFSVE